MNKKELILRNLFALARDNNQYRIKHAAAVYKRNTLLSYGLNEYKSHPFQAEHSSHEEAIYWHAETKAIHNAIRHHGQKNIKGSTLFVARAKFDVSCDEYVQGLSRPCEGCMSAITLYGIKEIYYTNEFDGEFSYTRLILKEHT